MDKRRFKIIFLLLALIGGGILFLAPKSEAQNPDLNRQLAAVLAQNNFTGRINSTLEQRLGRPLDPRLVKLGNFLFFDTLIALAGDNACAGCHAPRSGFGDSQSIAIGIDNNNVVGPNRQGPRNQRRAPMLLNNAFYPTLMWNSRFFAVSGDPFDNRMGFQFPPPEGMTLSFLPHLLTAQANIPVTEKVEMAGFGSHVPGTNDGIREAVVARLNANSEYRQLFAKIFPSVNSGGPITYEMVARAIAEFEFRLTFSDAPIDRFARGNRDAMSNSEKRGALLFFGSARCVECHTVSGKSNEQFSDFREHVIGLPQIFPNPNIPNSKNVTYDGACDCEDFGLEQVSGNSNDRYKFRTSPLRNIALQPTFFHNGAFTRLDDAIRFHLKAVNLARNYNPARAGVDVDLQMLGPIEPVLQRIDPKLATPVNLSQDEFRALFDFVRNGLLDSRATPQRLNELIPDRVPSGRRLHNFENSGRNSLTVELGPIELGIGLL